MIALRLMLVVFGFVSALFGYWWMPLLCIVLLSLRFRAWECILLGLFVDFLWLSPGMGISGLPLFTIAAIIAVWIFEPLRQEFLMQ